MDDTYAVDAAATPDGELFVLAAEEDGVGYNARLFKWDLDGDLVVNEIVATEFPWAIAALPDGGAVLALGDAPLRAVDGTGQTVWEVDSPAGSGRAIATADNGEIWVAGGANDSMALARLTAAGGPLVAPVPVEGTAVTDVGVTSDGSARFVGYERTTVDEMEIREGLVGLLSADGTSLDVTRPTELDGYEATDVSVVPDGTFALLARAANGDVRHLVFEDGDVAFQDDFSDPNPDSGLALTSEGIRYVTRAVACPTCGNQEHQISTAFDDPAADCIWEEVWGSASTPRDSAAAVVPVDGAFYSVGSLNTQPAGSNNLWSTVVRRYTISE